MIEMGVEYIRRGRWFLSESVQAETVEQCVHKVVLACNEAEKKGREGVVSAMCQVYGSEVAVLVQAVINVAGGELLGWRSIVAGPHSVVIHRWDVSEGKVYPLQSGESQYIRE